MKPSNQRGDKPFQKFYKDKDRQEKPSQRKERKEKEDNYDRRRKDGQKLRPDGEERGSGKEYRDKSRSGRAPSHSDAKGKFSRKEGETAWKPKRSFQDKENNSFSVSRKRKWDGEKAGKGFDRSEGRRPKFKGAANGDRPERKFSKSRKDETSFHSKRKDYSPSDHGKKNEKEERGKRFEKADKNFTKQSFANKRRTGFGKFDEQDLSFGRKKEVKVKKEEAPEGEVTFSKEVKDKWQQEPVFYKHNFKTDRPARDAGKKHDHPQRKKGFENYFDGEEQPEKVYAAGGSRKRLGKSDSDLEESDLNPDSDEMPLNKFIAHCGVCGRREAAVLVKEGKAKVNGELVTEPGFKVSIKDQVSLSGKKLTLQQKLIYVLLNKPKGYITTTDDPKGRRTVLDIFEGHIEERIYPIGRLDRNTTGLLLLTNDGDLAQKLAHPSNEVKKVYQVSLDKPLSEADFEKIKNGVTLEDGAAPVDQIAYLDSKQEVGLEIHNGRNRIVRRIFESLGYVVEKLDRVMYAGLTKKRVPRGQWRFLENQEIINLKHLHRS